MSVKTRIAELNARLADTLTEKGVEADASETTTTLVDKVGEIEQGGTGIIDTVMAEQNGENNLDYYWAYSRCRVAKEEPLPLPPTKNVKSFVGTFWNSKPSHIPHDLDISSAEVTDKMFKQINQDSGFIGSVKNNGNLESLVLDMRNVKSAREMFDRFSYGMPRLLNTENLEDVYMFSSVRTWALNTTTGITSTEFLDLENSSKIKNFYRIFYYGYYLTKTALNVDSAEYMEAAFSDCISLTDLTLHGTLKCDLSLSKSPLTIESAKSVINALADFAGTADEYKHTITFSDATKALLEEEGATAPNGGTWLDYIEDKCWNY